MKPVYLLLSILLLVSPLLPKAQLNVIDSLLKIVAGEKKDVNELRALNKLADEYSRKDLKTALRYQREGIHLAKALNKNVLLSSGYSLMITLQGNTGNSDSAQHYMEMLKQLATNSNIDTIQGNYYAVAGLQIKKTGNYKAALPLLIKAEQVAAKLNNKVSQAGQCINIGNTYRETGDYKRSLHYQLKALRLFEEEGNKRGQSFCYGNIGTLFLYLRQFNAALPYFEKSMQLKKELNDKRGIGTALSGMANVYNGLKDYDKALGFAFEALAVTKELKLVKDEPGSHMEIAKFYYNKKDIEKAEEHFNRCKELALQNGDSSMIKTVDAELVVLQKNTVNEKHAEQKLYSSLRNALKNGNKKNELAAYQHLSGYYADKKQFDKALLYTNKFHANSETVQSTNLQLQIKKLEAQYNIEKKEQEIALLKKDQQLQQLNLQKQKTKRGEKEMEKMGTVCF